jgi:hypothetical protein
MVGIYIDSLDNQVDTAYILRNRFLASAVTNITANIVTGDIYNITIEDCVFGTGQPNGTGAKKYIHCAGTATGTVKNCYFGVTGTTMGGINTMSSLVSSGNFGLQGPMQT